MSYRKETNQKAADPEASLDRDLERLREAQPAAPAYLKERIVANLPERDPGQELLDWLRASAWRGVTAAALPLLLGFAIGLSAGDDAELDMETDSLIFAEVWEAYQTDEI